MLYIVHIVNDQSTRSFQAHKSAFDAFKSAAKRNRTVALWHCNKEGQWTIVHSTGFYPTSMTKPPSLLYDSNKGAA